MRPLTSADGPLLHRLMGNPQVFFWAEQPVTYEDACELLAAKTTITGPGLGWWPVFLHPKDSNARQTTGDFIGQVCAQPLPGSDEIELGYHFLPHAWGNGYATEAATALLVHVFSQTDLDLISAVVLPDNHQSLGVVDRLGFKHRGEKLHGKKPLLHHYFELKRSDFAARHASLAATGE